MPAGSFTRYDHPGEQAGHYADDDPENEVVFHLFCSLPLQATFLTDAYLL